MTKFKNEQVSCDIISREHHCYYYIFNDKQLKYLNAYLYVYHIYKHIPNNDNRGFYFVIVKPTLKKVPTISVNSRSHSSDA